MSADCPAELTTFLRSRKLSFVSELPTSSTPSPSTIIVIVIIICFLPSKFPSVSVLSVSRSSATDCMLPALIAIYCTHDCRSACAAKLLKSKTSNQFISSGQTYKLAPSLFPSRGSMDLLVLRVSSLLMFVLLMLCILAEGATLFSELSESLAVYVTGADNSSPNGTKAGTNELFVTWALNSTAQVDDSAYRSVELKLCFGAPSQIDRRWRKTNDILSKDKSCSFDIGSPQPYQRAGNSTVWIVGNDIPFAQYFVRAYGLDSAGEKVAYGQSSNAQRTSNLFTVEPISGRRASIDISAAVFSAFSVLSLFGFFLYEKMSAKGNKA